MTLPYVHDFDNTTTVEKPGHSFKHQLYNSAFRDLLGLKAAYKTASDLITVPPPDASALTLSVKNAKSQLKTP